MRGAGSRGVARGRAGSGVAARHQWWVTTIVRSQTKTDWTHAKGIKPPPHNGKSKPEAGGVSGVTDVERKGRARQKLTRLTRVAVLFVLAPGGVAVVLEGAQTHQKTEDFVSCGISGTPWGEPVGRLPTAGPSWGRLPFPLPSRAVLEVRHVRSHFEHYLYSFR